MHSYPKVWHLGHKNVIGMSNSEVIVQEKYDGSQFSFEKVDGELKCKSRRTTIDLEDLDKLFGPTVAHLQTVLSDIKPNWVYRGEAFKSNRHNTKKYDMVPKGHLVLFDIEIGHHTFLSPKSVIDEAALLGVEHASLLVELSEGMGVTQDLLDELLDTESSLGGGRVEGVVFKNYDQQTPFGEPMFAKFVSEEFKESHKQNLDWKQGKDLYHALGSQFATEARWRKSVQRLGDSGELGRSPKDIGLLLKELSIDLLDEYGDELKERVWKGAWKRISKAANAGFPEWYKRDLVFGNAAEDIESNNGEDETRRAVALDGEGEGGRGEDSGLALAQGDGDDGGRVEEYD